MSPEADDSPINIPSSFMKGQIVFDIVYNPVKTKFLSIAKSEGAATIDGLKMFVYQGAKSFELWTGQEMPVEKILNGLKMYFAQ